MNNELYTTELLTRYLDQELSSEETLALEKRLASEEALREELNRLKLAREALRLYGLKEQVGKIHKEMRTGAKEAHIEKRNNLRVISRWAMRVAAIIIVAAAGIGIYQYATLSNEKLFKEQFQPYEIRTSRGENNERPIEAAYRRKDYAAVIAAFNNSSVRSTVDYFLLGQVHLQQNNPKEAVRILELAKASADTSHLYKDESEYYLALAYLQNDQSDKALTIFKRIHSDPNHLFRDKVNKWFLRRVSVTSD